MVRYIVALKIAYMNPFSVPFPKLTVFAILTWIEPQEATSTPMVAVTTAAIIATITIAVIRH